MLGFYKMSIIGTAHQAKKHGVCQDASDVIVLENGWIVACIADGLGSAKKSEIGSAVAVKTILSFIKENYPEKWHEDSLISLLRTAYHKALKTIKVISIENQDELYDYDTTLTTVIYNGVNVAFGHVGDGGIIALSSYGDYSLLTVPQKGEAFNETSPLRSGPDNWSFGFSREDVCSLIMMTDGIFDIAYPWLLAKTNQPIYINYVRPFMDRNILNVSTPADFENAQDEIREFFCGEYSKQITDDKTIVGIINTDVTPEIKSDEYYLEPDWQTLAKEHHDRLYKKPEVVGDDVSKDEVDNVTSENLETVVAEVASLDCDTIGEHPQANLSGDEEPPTENDDQSTTEKNQEEQIVSSEADDTEKNKPRNIFEKLFKKK